MIKSFAHKGVEVFFATGSKAGIQPAHADRLRRQLAHLNFRFDGGDAMVVDYQDYH